MTHFEYGRGPGAQQGYGSRGDQRYDTQRHDTSGQQWRDQDDDYRWGGRGERQEYQEQYGRGPEGAPYGGRRGWGSGGDSGGGSGSGSWGPRQQGFNTQDYADRTFGGQQYGERGYGDPTFGPSSEEFRQAGPRSGDEGWNRYSGAERARGGPGWSDRDERGGWNGERGGRNWGSQSGYGGQSGYGNQGAYGGQGSYGGSSGYGRSGYRGSSYGSSGYGGQGGYGRERDGDRFDDRGYGGRSDRSFRDHGWNEGSSPNEGWRTMSSNQGSAQDTWRGRDSMGVSSGWSGRARGSAPRGYQRSDERIREDICECVMDHGDIDAEDVQIDVSQGTVTLEGTCTSRRTKMAIEEIADSVSGVQDVENQIRVKKSERSRDSSSSDDRSSSNTFQSSGTSGSKTGSQTSGANGGTSTSRSRSTTDTGTYAGTSSRKS